MLMHQILKKRKKSLMIQRSNNIYAASKAVYDKLNDKSKPLTERIDNVNKYCNVAVKNKDKFLDITENEG